MWTRMKSTLKSGLAIAVVATSFAALGTPTQAAEAGASADGSYQVAQNWNGPRGGWNGNRHWHGGRGWNHGGGYYYRDNNNWGAAAAAGAIGLATGAIIANSANQQRYYDDYGPQYSDRGAYGSDYVSYCSSRYRSFNPRTGTYTGYDGYQHRCVMP